jgi:hypothetical protein
VRHAAAAAGLASALLLWIPSCADVLGLGGERNVANELCDLLERCYGEAAPPDCHQSVGTALARADGDVASRWLTGFADASCLADCTTARRCLDAEPVCEPVGEDCAVLEQCCGFTRGKGSCDVDAERCCRPRGTSCSSDADCCSDAGRCAEQTGTCGGVVCKEAGAACALDVECCTKLCDDGGLCAETICLPDGAQCAADDACCTGVCQDGVCGIPGCGGEGAPCDPSQKCCPELTCFSAAEGVGVCSVASCLPDGLPCAAPEACCSGYCDPTYAACATPPECRQDGERCDPTDFCCFGPCNESGLCGCGGEGFHCIFPSDCCSGICDGETCGTPGCADYGEACSNSDGCCSGTCSAGGVCVWNCGNGAADFDCFSDVCATSPLPLDPSCGRSEPQWVDAECVTSICTADSWCCCTEWDWLCVEKVATYCGFSC